MREFPSLPHRDPPAHRPAAILVRLALAGACALAVSACVTAREQQAMDRGRCAEYGFEPGTDAFAQCMMGVTQHREMLAQDRQIAQRAQLAAQNREHERRRDLNRLVSLQRSGDRSYPVCSASSFNNSGFDARSGSWYGPNCRAR
ncbi:hypothetical protein [uncultured Methylobacterium sp.]|jgi:hypothetical protein|uniref:hypothetical protein n=1 Tax=uncultured Methylobacterium sp. TaxID=157278 RepID=UPI00261E5EB9|nr:hypothetical protein [uncultured Methylobacterium sp.]